VPAGWSVWVGEVLIGTDGKVARVWTLRGVEFKPPWPEFNEAIVAAIRESTFEATILNGRPVPVCMSMTMNVDW
jgi:hypothetical protein